jgi:CheY-like chemotaxis protein
MTELVLNTAVTVEQREYLFALRRSASSLLEIVNDLLDLSKIQAEKIQLEPEVFDLRSAIEDVRMTLAPQSEAKHITLETSVESEVPLAIEGDPLRLRQVLVNLGSNAIKSTDAGFARVRVYLQQSMGSQVRLCFSVEDSGCGLRSEISRDDCGSGLGLSIASELVKLMGGEIAVENRPGIGSVFSFCCTFPVGEIDESASAQPDIPRAYKCIDTPLHILVAEDNAVNQLVVVRLLKTRGHSVEVAATGSEAVHAVCSRQFDLVLMDNQMPELSGIEATIRLREMGYTLPIVALSASAMAEDRERFLAAGMNGCLSKPFRPEELYAEIERATSPSERVTPF